jgi:hypothetical protein
MSVGLFVAGSATGHDSVELYRELEGLLRTRYRLNVSVLEVESPIERARLVASARLWIGTSLHGLVLSTAFDVPSVGLELRKLKDYSDTWGLPQPVNVTLKELESAIETAFRVQRNGMLERRSTELSGKAEISIRTACTAFDERSAKRQRLPYIDSISGLDHMHGALGKALMYLPSGGQRSK